MKKQSNFILQTKIYCGVDVGTTRTKVTLIDEKGEVLYSEAVRINHFTNNCGNPNDVFLSVVSLLKYSLKQLKRETSIVALAVSTHAPTLCAFNPYHHDQAVCISYSFRTQLPNYFSAFEKTRSQVTLLLNKVGKMNLGQSFEISSLAGYLNIRLGGRNSLDPVTAWELGLSTVPPIDSYELSPTDFALKKMQKIPILNAFDSIKIDSFLSKSLILLSTGTTDTVASVIGCSEGNNKLMIYSGTFGSLLKINVSMKSLLTTNKKEDPYSWLVSQPDFGESFALLAKKSGCSLEEYFNNIEHRWLNNNEFNNRLKEESFVSCFDTHFSPFEIGFYVLKFFGDSVSEQLEMSSDDNDTIWVTGGLGSIPSYCEVLGKIIDRTIKVPTITEGSYGSALLAANIWGSVVKRNYSIYNSI